LKVFAGAIAVVGIPFVLEGYARSGSEQSTLDNVFQFPIHQQRRKWGFRFLSFFVLLDLSFMTNSMQQEDGGNFLV